MRFIKFENNRTQSKAQAQLPNVKWKQIHIYTMCWSREPYEHSEFVENCSQHKCKSRILHEYRRRHCYTVTAAKCKQQSQIIEWSRGTAITTTPTKTKSICKIVYAIKQSGRVVNTNWTKQKKPIFWGSLFALNNWKKFFALIWNVNNAYQCNCQTIRI